jgi:hypothetical protein
LLVAEHAHVALLLRELALAKPSWRPNAEALSVYASRLGAVAPLALERAVDEWVCSPSGFAPSPGELLESARRAAIALQQHRRERRERLSNGLSRRRVTDAVEILADPNATVPSVIDISTRHARWSAKDIACAQSVLAEHRLTLERARELLAEEPPSESSLEEQAAAVASRVRGRLGLEARKER